ncbi:hypothetical protein [Paractinoplanes lichenicola]|uniref:Uncharacterized protein n=1 Tax=Paractinoplanes lichenicola TaxID=2802976 RepID=A0ABS1W3M4_9ACTN|nr:hypothetical protein [Actinoplanes lichenicola]MBL7261345.1 hypothetical protein [Actinoplanes lichenicola]
MNEKSLDFFKASNIGADQGHPVWCDQSLCTVDPASQADGYRSGVGGEHRSAAAPLDVRPCEWPVPDQIEVFLTQAVAPWRCSTIMRIVADGEDVVSLPVESAGPIIATLTGLVGAAEAGEWVSSR